MYIRVYGVLFIVVGSDASFAGNSATELEHIGPLKFSIALAAQQYERRRFINHDANSYMILS